jgi:hypothetical protein
MVSKKKTSSPTKGEDVFVLLRSRFPAEGWDGTVSPTYEPTKKRPPFSYGMADAFVRFLIRSSTQAPLP